MSLADLTAAQLAQKIAAGETTATDAVNDCLTRIEAREGTVGAWAHLDPVFARRQAEKLDAVRASGAALGPLHGVPVGIKDIIDTDDLPTEYGTVLKAGHRPFRDATVVARLKAAGAIIMGKTVTTEFAVYSPGKTTNPHDATRTPGGSSSGSAAAVAAGMVPLAIGSQTNGSVIRPASFCGVVGFKPTHGQISRAGVLPLSQKLDHVGAFARTVEDAALLGDVLFGHDREDPDTRPKAAPRLQKTTLSEPPAPPRYAFLRTPFWDRAEPATQEAFTELAEFLGANCVEEVLHEEFDRAADYLRTIMYPDLAFALDRYFENGADQISAILTGMVEEGRAVTALDYNRAASRIEPMNAWLARIFEDYDAILTLSTPGEAPVGLDATGDPIFCSTWSLLGTPAITLPLMQGEAGMPLGVQLVGERGDDARLLRTAQQLAAQVAAG